jgi:hypothetical protein
MLAAICTEMLKTDLFHYLPKTNFPQNGENCHPCSSTNSEFIGRSRCTFFDRNGDAIWNLASSAFAYSHYATELSALESWEDLWLLNEELAANTTLSCTADTCEDSNGNGVIDFTELGPLPVALLWKEQQGSVDPEGPYGDTRDYFHDTTKCKTRVWSDTTQSPDFADCTGSKYYGLESYKRCDDVFCRTGKQCVNWCRRTSVAGATVVTYDADDCRTSEPLDTSEWVEQVNTQDSCGCPDSDCGWCCIADSTSAQNDWFFLPDTNQPSQSFELPAFNVADIKIDFTNINASMVYGKDYRISVYSAYKQILFPNVNWKSHSPKQTSGNPPGQHWVTPQEVDALRYARNWNNVDTDCKPATKCPWNNMWEKTIDGKQAATPVEFMFQQNECFLGQVTRHNYTVPDSLNKLVTTDPSYYRCKDLATYADDPTNPLGYCCWEKNSTYHFLLHSMTRIQFRIELEILNGFWAATADQDFKNKISVTIRRPFYGAIPVHDERNDASVVLLDSNVLADNIRAVFIGVMLKQRTDPALPMNVPLFNEDPDGKVYRTQTILDLGLDPKYQPDASTRKTSLIPYPTAQSLNIDPYDNVRFSENEYWSATSKKDDSGFTNFNKNPLSVIPMHWMPFLSSCRGGGLPANRPRYRHVCLSTKAGGDFMGDESSGTLKVDSDINYGFEWCSYAGAPGSSAVANPARVVGGLWILPCRPGDCPDTSDCARTWQPQVVNSTWLPGRFPTAKECPAVWDPSSNDPRHQLFNQPGFGSHLPIWYMMENPYGCVLNGHLKTSDIITPWEWFRSTIKADTCNYWMFCSMEEDQKKNDAYSKWYETYDDTRLVALTERPMTETDFHDRAVDDYDWFRLQDQAQKLVWVKSLREVGAKENWIPTQIDMQIQYYQENSTHKRIVLSTMSFASFTTTNKDNRFSSSWRGQQYAIGFTLTPMIWSEILNNFAFPKAIYYLFFVAVGSGLAFAGIFLWAALQLFNIIRGTRPIPVRFGWYWTKFAIIPIEGFLIGVAPLMSMCYIVYSTIGGSGNALIGAGWLDGIKGDMKVTKIFFAFFRFSLYIFVT